ncbi:MAG: hypothetical protein HYU61_15330 [Brevundimonas diminuta]|nr:hypothetical protein [Brevundimonas diminuta]
MLTGMSEAHRRTHTDSIGLAGDGDDVDLIRAIESSFQVQFGNDTAKWFTVGDIYEALLTRIPVSSTAGLCATSMAFYRIRAELVRTNEATGRVEPASKLAGLTSLPPKQLYSRLSRELGVGALPITLSWWGTFGLVALLFGLVGGLFVFKVHAFWPVLLLLPAGVAMTSTDVGTYRSTTSGDLARTVAIRNFRLFASDGADNRPATLWRALCGLIADETQFDAARISASTRLVG